MTETKMTDDKKYQNIYGVEIYDDRIRYKGVTYYPEKSIPEKSRLEVLQDKIHYGTFTHANGPIDELISILIDEGKKHAG